MGGDNSEVVRGLGIDGAVFLPGIVTRLDANKRTEGERRFKRLGQRKRRDVFDLV